MRNKRNGKNIVLALIALFVIGIVLLAVRIIIKSEKWAFYPTNKHVYAGGQLTNIGTVSDRNGNVLSYTKDNNRIYNENKDVRMSTIHAVGDPYGYISTGVTTALKDKLTGYSLVNGFYALNNDITYNAQLTIDSQVSAAAMNALGNFSGCVCLCNYKTGEIICMVSTPTYDIADEVSVKAAKEGKLGAVYINRCISSVYTTGSVFKIVTSVAAIETLSDDAYTTQVLCNYGTEIDSTKVSCVGKHSSITLKDAFAHSCNAYFANMGLSLGREIMTKYAEMCGFNKTFYIDTIKTASSVYNVKNASNLDFAWSAIGQHNDQLNPVAFLSVICGLANDGSYKELYFVKEISDSNGKTVYTPDNKTVNMMKRDTANKVAELMDYAVEVNYGKNLFGNLDVCGKTGTAEMGDGIENSLFVGFCKNEELPLAFVVIAEGGGSGKTSALTVAAKTLRAAEQSLEK